MAKRVKQTAREAIVAKAKRRIGNNQRRVENAEIDFNALKKECAKDTAYQREVLKAVGEG